jgi:hypothetical protein
MGRHSFWRGDKPRNAMRGLLHVYANTPELPISDIFQLRNLIDEFAMRLEMACMTGIYQAEEGSAS